MRWSVWLFVIMFVTSFIFAFPSLFRGRLLGVVMDALGCVAAMIGLYGTLNISWKIVAFSIIVELFLGIGFLAFIVLNYYASKRADDPYAWTVLALYLPNVAFTFITAFAVMPFCLSYYRLASREGASATSSSAREA